MATEIPTTIDIDLTYRTSRARWLKESAPRRTLADWFGMLTPWSICFVFAATYALSAPHTAAVWDLITPGWGWLAPIAVEVGLIWSAFEIRRAKSANASPLPAARFLRWFMLVIAVTTNAAGGFRAVVSGTGVTELSAEALWAAYAGLPFMTQIALLMTVIAALAVPITAEATGGGIAQQVFERRSRDDFRERAWLDAAFQETARACYVQYSRAGYAPDDARRLSVAAVRGYMSAGAGRSPSVRSAPGQTPHLLTNGQTQQTGQMTKQTANGDKMEAARAYLETRPELHEQSINAVWRAMVADGVKVGRDTAYKALQTVKEAQQ